MTDPQLTPIQADLVKLLHEIGAVIEEECGRWDAAKWWDAGAIEVRLIMQGDGARPVQVAIGPYGDVEWKAIGERQRDLKRRLEPPLDSFVVAGRGRVWVVVEPDPVLTLGEIVEIGGSYGKVVGLEHHPVGTDPKPGDKVGVLITEWIGYEPD